MVSWRASAGGHGAPAALAHPSGAVEPDGPGRSADDSAASNDIFVTEDQELPRVMAEIVDAMNGHGGTLTLHPEDGRPAQLLHVDAVITTPFIRRLLMADLLWPKLDPGDLYGWKTVSDVGPITDAFVMPVQRVEGHSRLVISIFFQQPTAEERARAEDVYLRRRPFAVGYFRLWQEQRSYRKMTAVLRAAVDLTAIGIMLINGAGESVFANTAATDLLKSGGGLRERHGRIMATTLRDSARLQAAIDHVVLADDAKVRRVRAPMLAIRRDGKPALIVSIFPTSHEGDDPGDVAAILFAVDPTQDVEQLLEPVCKLFQLSHVETRLACQLAAGATLQEAAAKLRIKEPTARGYLKQVFIKTGTNRQAALMRIMLSSLVRTTGDVAFDVV